MSCTSQESNLDRNIAIAQNLGCDPVHVDYAAMGDSKTHKLLQGVRRSSMIRKCKSAWDRDISTEEASGRSFELG